MGYHPGLKKKAIITYSTNHGIRVWYWYDNPEEVTNEEFLKETQIYLLDIAKERGIDAMDVRRMHPGRLAHLVFMELIPELGA